MTLKFPHLVAVCICAASPVLAGDAPVALTYDQFEIAVPHLDLAECPDSITHEGTFCRATLHNDEIHIFAFSEEGNQSFVGFTSFPADGLAALLKE